MRCELVKDEHGWWMQYIGDDGRYHCTLMEAQNENEAELEAREEGFSQIVIIPKPPVP